MRNIISPISRSKNSPAIPSGAVYNRNGDFLYSAQLFDNGMDYWEGGLRRYVEDNKMGFLNRSGEKVLPAKWDFVNPFYYGYAIVVEGNLTSDQDGSKDKLGFSGDTVSYVINQRGERIEPMQIRNHPRDYFYQGKYYTYPFSYSKKRERIIIECFKIYSRDINLELWKCL